MAAVSPGGGGGEEEDKDHENNNQAASNVIHAAIRLGCQIPPMQEGIIQSTVSDPLATFHTSLDVVSE